MIKKLLLITALMILLTGCGDKDTEAEEVTSEPVYEEQNIVQEDTGTTYMSIVSVYSNFEISAQVASRDGFTIGYDPTNENCVALYNAVGDHVSSTYLTVVAEATWNEIKTGNVPNTDLPVVEFNNKYYMYIKPWEYSNDKYYVIAEVRKPITGSFDGFAEETAQAIAFKVTDIKVN